MSPETFTYHGVELPYLTHLYNITYLTERRVEVPIATHWIAQQANTVSGVEVGNVLGHYSWREHIVVDRDEPPAWYQQHQLYLNQDLFELNLPSPYIPWVVSISTIEHTSDPLKAMDILRELVIPGGSLLITFPAGVRAELDGFIDGLNTADNPKLFTRWCTLARTTDGEWAQTSHGELRPYGPWANSVFIGEWERPA
jgi:hypothetical protein